MNSLENSMEDMGVIAPAPGEQEPQEPAEIAAEEQGSPAAEPTFRELIRGKYKKDYDENVQRTVRERLRKSGEELTRLRAERDSLSPLLQKLSERYGTDDPEALLQAADSLPAPPDKDALFSRLAGEEAALKEKFPKFDMGQELKNERFFRLVQNGASSEAAYFAVHHKELLSQAMEVAARKTAQRTAGAIASSADRTRESGLQGGSSAELRADPAAFSREKREKIRRAVLEQGRRVTPDSELFRF